MSTSDQHQHVADQSTGGSQLTRKQLREARLTGSNPIVTPEEAEAARRQSDAPVAPPVAEPVVAPAPPAPEPAPQVVEPAPQVVEPAPPLVEPAPPLVEPAPPLTEPVGDASRDAEEPLTRRQVREQERIRTASVPVSPPTSQSAPVATAIDPVSIPTRPAPPTAAAPSVPAPTTAPDLAAGPNPARAVETPVPSVPSTPAPHAPAERSGMITDVPRPVYPSRRRSFEPTATASRIPVEEQDGVDDAEQGVAPVSASSMMRAEEEAGRLWRADTAPAGSQTHENPVAASRMDPAELFAPVLPAVPASTPEPELDTDGLPFSSEHAALWSAPPAEAAPAEDVARVASAPEPSGGSAPTLNLGFGERLLAEEPKTPRVDSFDALIGDSTGSHHAAPNALIFQQAPTGPSLSGPVASTGEILVTGSYDLPSGFGSRGHADGVADGKEVDAVLVDGELAPASSPTPIAASAAIGTIKPAGEVIRPPAPEKGNKLMLALTITAGALAVALVGALIVAITTGALS